MAQYDNTNTFVLFANDKKGNEKAPDYKGSYTDGSGVEMDIAAWSRKSKTGTPYLSGKISAKRQVAPAPVIPDDNRDESVPF